MAEESPPLPSSRTSPSIRPSRPSPAPAGPPTPGVPIDRRQLVPRLLLGWAALLARYHQHRVVGLESLAPLLAAGRRLVLVSNHVFDLTDPLLFVAAFAERYGRVPHFIGQENVIFHSPGLRQLALGWGVIPSRQMDEAGEALERDGLLMLFPGGGSEAALRRFRTQPYRLWWSGRRGFLRLALEHDAEVVFVATVGSEEMYYQSRLPTPDTLLALFNAERYHHAPLTFGLLGPHLMPGVFPFPAQLTHHVSPALDMGERARALADAGAFERLHARVWHECQAFLDAAVLRREAEASRLDRIVRGAQLILQGMGL